MLKQLCKRVSKLFFIYLAFALFGVLIVLTFGAISASCQEVQTTAPKINIKNFGRMDERFYRGAQPKESDYKDLSALGINTVIDLRDDPKPYAKRSAETSGIRYVNIPMDDKSYPKEEHISTFLKTVDDPQTGKFFVHCAGGRHRTGVMGAIYRIRYYGWIFEAAYLEMKKYDFYTRWGHGEMKKYVQDYSQRPPADNGESKQKR